MQPQTTGGRVEANYSFGGGLPANLAPSWTMVFVEFSLALLLRRRPYGRPW